MAGGGSYIKPSIALKEALEKHFGEIRPLIEIAGFFLVFTGLLLNIEITPNLVGQCVRLLQFFSLSGSLIFLVIILVNLLNLFGHPFMEWIERKHSRHHDHEILRLIKKITLMLFPFVIFFFFTLTLFLYLVFSFTTEFVFLLGITCSYVLVYFTARLNASPGNLTQILVSVLGFLFLFIMPLFLYVIVLFPDLPHMIAEYARSL